ncbi:nucleosome assembly protein 1;3-like [Chenopodium quinoa]|uniref:nucleosome assembly protein 1;3-like n=1 Tax=Chenopodium quinoa TaxID=63459 RepID=UPI000B77BC85|nr:nucleosome assembly protein 1;3-like [Chenopodium quinoa]
MANNDINMSTIAAALNSADKSAILNALKAAKAENESILDKLPPNVQKRVEVLRQIQSDHDELEAKFFEERRALEDKYQKLYQPLYTKRYEIVNGVVEVEGVVSEPATEEADKAAEEKGVPNFWVTAMKTNEVLAESIQERDEEALKYLKDIKWSRVELPKDDVQKGEASKGFKLEFFFDPNPFFTNSVLTKTYYMIDEDEPILEKAIGTEIEWCPGKCLTQKVLKKKPKKGSKNSKPITKTEAVDSFFNFFSPPDVPEDEEEIDEDAADELQALMEQDYDVGSTIRDKIIPHAVSWFTGEAAQDDDFVLGEDDDIDEDDEDEDEDEDDEDEDEDDEDEDDDEEDDKPSHQKKRGAKTSGVAQQSGERPPECKQQ